jgi:hypothetical protein
MMEERMKRIVSISLATLSTAVMSTCPLLASTPAQAAVATVGADGSLMSTINYGGPATATLVIAGKTYKFKNGTCLSIKESGVIDEVNLGSVVTGKNGGVATGNGKKPHFSLDISSRTSGVLAGIYSGGKNVTSGGTVTVKGTVVKSGLSKGTFQAASGALDLSGNPFSVSGSWNCHGKFTKE